LSAPPATCRRTKFSLPENLSRALDALSLAVRNEDAVCNLKGPYFGNDGIVNRKSARLLRGCQNAFNRTGRLYLADNFVTLKW
jgi:hypothetical protein